MAANALSQRLIDDYFEGAKNDIENPDVERLAGRTAPQSTTRGVAQLLPTIDTLGRAPDRGLPEGVTPERLERTYGELSYVMRVFKQTTGIPFAEENDWAQNQSEDLGEKEMGRCMRTAYIKGALHLSYVLGYNTDDDQQVAQADQNNIHVDAVAGDVDGSSVSYLAGTAWDQSSAVPITDIKAIIREVCPGADYAIAGRGILDVFGGNAEFASKDNHYSGGVINRDRVREILVNETDLDEVETFESHFNVADQGLTVDKKYVFKNGFWLGYKRDLVWMPLSTDNPRSIRQEEKEDEETVIGTSMRGIYKRPLRDLGVSVGALSSVTP
jgi:hypothetical protein